MAPYEIDFGTVRHDAPRVHMLGIAGSGMSALAEVMRQLGWQVSGCDAGSAEFPNHCGNHIDPGLDLLIVSDAVGEGHIERIKASQQGVRCLTYAEMLGRLTARRRLLAIAGTHGKSTTTAMLSQILAAGDQHGIVVFGARDIDGRPGGTVGSGPLSLVEACEYRRHFLQLRPWQSAILGVEADHFDYFRDQDDLQSAFEEFASQTTPSGGIIVNHDSPLARQAARAVSCPVETFGLTPGADYRATDIRFDSALPRFRIDHAQHRAIDVSLRVPGLYHIANALAAAAVAMRAGIAADQIALGLGLFRGLGRRLQRLGQWRGVELLDDYAHHPTEIDVTLDAVALMHPGRRVWAVFQPHQASRTARLFNAFASSLARASRVIVADVFRAREPAAAPGEVTASDLARAVRRIGGDVATVYSIDRIQQHLRDQLIPGDVLLTLGAGDIWKLHDEFYDRNGAFHSNLRAVGAPHMV